MDLSSGFQSGFAESPQVSRVSESFICLTARSYTTDVCEHFWNVPRFLALLQVPLLTKKAAK